MEQKFYRNTEHSSLSDAGSSKYQIQFCGEKPFKYHQPISRNARIIYRVRTSIARPNLGRVQCVLTAMVMELKASGHYWYMSKK